VGATRWRLIRQLLLENIILTLGGIAGGLIIAAASGPLLLRALPPMRDPSTAKLSLTVQSGIDWRVFLFVLAVSVLTTLLFGFLPALIASRTSIDNILRGSRATRGWRGRKFAVTIQVAVCTVLLVCTGLLGRTLYELQSTNPGFDRDHVVTATINS